MKIAFFANLQKTLAPKIAAHIVAELRKRGAQIFMETPGHVEGVSELPLAEVPAEEIDFRITLGGDGTILRAVHLFEKIEAPLLGINHGSLGFMADTPIEKATEAIELLFKGDFSIEERMTLSADCTLQGSTLLNAVNEIVIHRGSNPCLIDLEITIDGIYLNTFSSDGMIFATPNGSTAYSMAAGGPILSTDLVACLITPICPHTVSNRPLVVLPKKEIKIVYLNEKEPLDIIIDGFYGPKLIANHPISIKQGAKSLKIVILPGHDSFFLLRSKLGWSGTIRA